MGGMAEKKRDLEQAKALRAEREALKMAKAMRMLSDGFTVEEASRAVGADPRTVKMWRSEATSTGMAR